MRRNFLLGPLGPADHELVFSWDPDSGDLSGPAAEQVKRMMDRAQKNGSVLSHPYPTHYEITAPLHTPAEFAAVLSFRWKLDDFLQSAFMKLEKPTEQNNDDKDCITLY